MYARVPDCARTAIHKSENRIIISIIGGCAFAAGGGDLNIIDAYGMRMHSSMHGFRSQSDR